MTWAPGPSEHARPLVSLSHIDGPKAGTSTRWPRHLRPLLWALRYAAQHAPPRRKVRLVTTLSGSLALSGKGCSTLPAWNPPHRALALQRSLHVFLWRQPCWTRWHSAFFCRAQAKSAKPPGLRAGCSCRTRSRSVRNSHRECILKPLKQKRLSSQSWFRKLWRSLPRNFLATCMEDFTSGTQAAVLNHACNSSACRLIFDT